MKQIVKQDKTVNAKMERNQKVFGRSKQDIYEALLDGRISVNKEAFTEKKHSKKEMLERG